MDVSFETYLRHCWDVQRDVVTTSLRRLVAGWDDKSNANYDVGNKIIYNTEVLKSNFCDYNDAYIFVRGIINIIGHQATQVALKNCSSFTKCITKVDATVDDTEDLDLVTPMYNLIEYSSKYSETTGSLCLYSKDEF